MRYREGGWVWLEPKVCEKMTTKGVNIFSKNDFNVTVIVSQPTLLCALWTHAELRHAVSE